MTKLQTLFAPLFLLLIVASCDNQKKLYDEVMAVHDEAMPKMDNIMNLKEKLEAREDSLRQDTTREFSAELQKISALKTQLDSADESMMMWMREFHQDYESMTKAEITEYLNKQKQRITQVGLFMNSAIAEAEEYLSE